VNVRSKRGRVVINHKRVKNNKERLTKLLGGRRLLEALAAAELIEKHLKIFYNLSAVAISTIL